LSDKLAKAFQTWVAPNAKCTPGIAGIELAPSSATSVAGYTRNGPNENLVGVASTWNYGESVLAMPIYNFNPSTGELLDVDLELNPNYKWSFGDPTPEDGYDLEAILAHGVGHMLGFAHSDVAEATMYGRYDSGDTSQRTLAADDEQAICDVYPNRTQRLASSGLVPSTPCNLSPGGGCGDAEITHGCSTSGTGTSSTAPGVLASVMAMLGLARLRRLRRT
jgi:hypothetical protein